MIRNKKGALFATVAIVIFLGYFLLPYLGKESAPKRTIKGRNAEPVFKKEARAFWVRNNTDTLPALDIELAETPYEIETGLMYRSFMEEQAGMLFVFPDERPRSFWMKNTKISLDIIYLDRNYKMVSAAENATPYSERSLPSAGPAQYVLEVNAGYVQQNKLNPGDQMVLKR